MSSPTAGYDISASASTSSAANPVAQFGDVYDNSVFTTNQVQGTGNTAAASSTPKWLIWVIVGIGGVLLWFFLNQK